MGHRPLTMHSPRRAKPTSGHPSAAPVPPRLSYFATAAKGTEGLLRQELRELGISPLQGDRGGVHFGGGLDDAFRVCLLSRIAIRVLELRTVVKLKRPDDLYAAVFEADLDDLLDPIKTLAVKATVHSSQLTHSQFVSRRVKDAIVDRQRARFGRRSNVDPRDPDVPFVVRLARDEMSLYVDLAGEPLHRRGYRASGAAAPIKENLAAALLRLASYDGSLPLVDPCCGSGTIVLEAAMIASRRAPGLGRARFAMERFVRCGSKESEHYRSLRQRAYAEQHPQLDQKITGADVDFDALKLALQSKAQLRLDVHFERRDLLQSPPPDAPGIVVTNPPYGVRLEGGEALDRRIGQRLSRWSGHRLVVLSAGPGLARALGKHPTFEHTLFNGNIECRAYGWDL